MEKKDKKKDKKDKSNSEDQAPPLDSTKLLYGVTFEESARRSDPDWIIPRPWRECISYLERYGTDSEGIFRIPGSLTEINDFIDKYNKGQPVVFELRHIDTVASLLVKFLQRSPSSLYDNSDNQIVAAAMSGDAPAMIRALKSLSLCSREMLKMLCHLLLKIADQSATSKMTLDTLGICFGPSFSSSLPFICRLLAEEQYPETIVFGIPLARSTANGLPLPLRISMEFIEKEGIDQEDIYKESGSVTKIKEFKFMFNSGLIPKYEAPVDISNAVGVIIAYLQSIPEPLFGDQKDALMKAADLPESEQVATYTTLLRKLPRANQLILKEFSQHLYRVSQHSARNKMTVQSLADTLGMTWRIIFVPLITHSQVLWLSIG